MSSHEKGKIAYALHAINIIPLLIFGLLLMIMGSNRLTKSMYAEIRNELEDSVTYLTTIYDTLYPGDYRLAGSGTYQIYKGEQDITNDFTIIDELHHKTGNDYTIYYKDTRILTTVLDRKGNRMVGTGAPQTVIDDVLIKGEPHFYTKTFFNHNSYFSFYAPIRNSDGTVVGIAFVGKPTAEVDEAVKRTVTPLIAAIALLIIVVSYFTSLYTKGFIFSLMEIRNFLKEVENGNLRTTLNASLIRRCDELGEIARSALSMQRSLHTLVEQDSLTALANRRSGDAKLREIIKDSTLTGHPFCIALGDIDLFKKVNDTYGHDCGDMILKNVAAVLRSHMRNNGFAARWGGEEFLLVFSNSDASKAKEILEAIMTEIRSLENDYYNENIKVTMTFGLVPGDTTNLTALLRIADEKLYTGKTNGRNQIVI